MYYKLTVTYGEPAGLLSSPCEFPHLTADQAEQSVGAFMRDMLGLPGSACCKVSIEQEPE
jgi:hypothetical protein